MSSDLTFEDVVLRATGERPYAYQSRLAVEGLPDLLRVPTGAGKTLAAVLPWVYRRQFHLDESVRASTPRRLVVVLPQRSLVEQTARVVREWVDRLGLADLHPFVLMGGLPGQDLEWVGRPDRDAILVGTQDMVLSRLLLRGYAEARASWPTSFGLLHAGTQFVFDEIQLMGPALPTSQQLEGLRRRLGTATSCASMWMSATVDRDRFDAPDFDGVERIVELDRGDREGPLRRRLEATRTVEAAQVDPKNYANSVGQLLVERHTPATRTLAVFNTVERASQVLDALSRMRSAPEIVLLHSRFRPAERATQMSRALAEPGPLGTIVVSTQVLEAGVDTDSQLLFTELAPWSSIVQRAGRCNRAGAYEEATLLWCAPPPGRASAPYVDKDLARSGEALTGLAGEAVTSERLQNLVVDEERPLYAVLRRRDLLDLFDTAPDLSGNDVDVTRWIRDADTVTTSVAWRTYGAEGPAEDAHAPAREELCPVPLAGLREHLSGVRRRRGWIFDQSETRWRRAYRDDVRPGAVLVLDAGEGGYTPDRGWYPASSTPVQPLELAVGAEPEGLESDPLSTTSSWVRLADHLEDVRRETEALLERMDPLPGLSSQQQAAAVRAGALHDLGKVHEVFAESLRRMGEPPDEGPWAKSGTRRRLRHSRPGFRHELVSALMVLDSVSGLLTGHPEPDLVAFLVAAHHGKVRMTARSAPVETGDYLLGVGRDEHTPPLRLVDDHEVPALTLRRDVFALGMSELGESWAARTCRLRDRSDLGPFRLAFLEAMVRLADWTASASYEEGR